MNHVLSSLIPALLDAAVVILTSINFSYFAADAYKSSFSAAPENGKVRKTLNGIFLWIFVGFSQGGRGLYLVSQKLSNWICNTGKEEKHPRLQKSVLLSVNVLLCLGILFLVKPIINCIFSLVLSHELNPAFLGTDFSVSTVMEEFAARETKDFTDYLVLAGSIPIITFAQFLYYCTIYGFLHTRILETRLSKEFKKGSKSVQAKYNEVQGMSSGKDAEALQLIGDGKSKFMDGVKVFKESRNSETSNTVRSFCASALYRIGSSLLERLEQIASLFVCFKNWGCAVLTIVALALILLLLQWSGKRPIATGSISELFMLEDIWMIIVNTVITIAAVKVFQILSQTVLKQLHCKKIFEYSDQLGEKAEKKIEEQKIRDKKNDPVFEAVNLLSKKEMMKLLSGQKAYDTISAMVKRGEITWREVHNFINNNKEWWDKLPQDGDRLWIILSSDEENKKTI